MVIFLSAAVALLPAGSPKGLLGFCAALPGLMCKLTLPTFGKDHINFTHRITIMLTAQILGLVIVAFSASLKETLIGVSFAALASGMGECTFFQLTATYTIPGVCITHYIAGTGVAGIIGSSIWWLLKGFGSKSTCLFLLALPAIMLATYNVCLPRPYDWKEHSEHSRQAIPDENNSEITALLHSASETQHLTSKLKLSLIKTIFLPYMVPLFVVYFLEYLINIGVWPTLLFTAPPNSVLLAHIFHRKEDFYPFYSLIYQTAVCLSRTSTIFVVKPQKAQNVRFYPLGQFLILLVILGQSSFRILGRSETTMIWSVILITFAEGLIGGCCYAMSMCSLSHFKNDLTSPTKNKIEHEFRMGVVSIADSFGVVLAMILAIPLELKLCAFQAANNGTGCLQK